MSRSSAATVVLTVLVVAYAALPLLWLVKTSLTPEMDLHQWPPRFAPAAVTAGHYADILGGARFWRQLGNSVFVCALATLASLAFGAWGAYGLARRRFRGRDVFLTSLLLLHLTPGVANMAAVYRAADLLGALDSLLFVALLKMTGVTVAVWILVAAFRRVPTNLEHAAELDGFSRR
jgi:multiple sugar transport system permease protein